MIDRFERIVRHGRERRSVHHGVHHHTFVGVETAISMGYTFFFHGADHKLPFVSWRAI